MDFNRYIKKYKTESFFEEWGRNGFDREWRKLMCKAVWSTTVKIFNFYKSQRQR